MPGAMPTPRTAIPKRNVQARSTNNRSLLDSYCMGTADATMARDHTGGKQARCRALILVKGVADGAPEIVPKNKAPLTRMSHGTPVKQPSPKCCSRTTLRFRLATGNGTDGPFPGPKAYPKKAADFG
jgi:hypothetical protein